MSKKSIDGFDLFQDHSPRVALIIGLIALSIHSFTVSLDGSSEERSTLSMLLKNAQLVVSGLCTLVFMNWFRLEISLIQMRKGLPPGKLGYPIVGTLPHIFQDLACYWPKKLKQYGSVFTDNGFAFQVVTTQEDAIAWLWNTERKGGMVSDWPPTIQQLLGKGAISNLNGKRHKALRRVMEPAFTPKATRDYLETIDQVTCKTLTEWSAAPSETTDSSGKTSPPFHPSEEFKSFSLRLFFVAAFGEEGDPKLVEKLHADFKLWVDGFAAIIPLRIPGLQLYKSMAARDRIRGMCEDMILKFKAENPKGSDRANKTMMGRACCGVDEEGNPMGMEDLKDNVLNMIFAGHDTTYASMGTAIHDLCEHPKVCQALVQEIKGFQEPLDFDELKNAPVLNAFLAEVWRIDPPIFQAQRKLIKTVEFGDYTFSKGVNVAYNVLLQTKSPDLFPEPEKFDIQRYLPAGHPLVEDVKVRKAAENVDFNSMKANYPIFGGGMHGCLGSQFAKLEMRVLVVRLLQSYRVEERNPEKIYFPINGWKTEFQLNPLKDSQ